MSVLNVLSLLVFAVNGCKDFLFCRTSSSPLRIFAVTSEAAGLVSTVVCT